LENEATIPRRFVSLAKLMQADLDALKENRSITLPGEWTTSAAASTRPRGPKVRSGKRVIASLRQLIEQLEQQQQAAAAAAAPPRAGAALDPAIPCPTACRSSKGTGRSREEASG
jgi:hypothetical protein